MKIVFWITTIAVLAAVPWMTWQKEKTLAAGQTMLLQLAPVDPRSLMQGDYMQLNYAIANMAHMRALDDEGFVIVKLDTNQVAHFVRLHADEPLSEGEYLLEYRKRGRLRFGAESYLFQEGHAGLFSNARYGELKVDPSGKSVLVGLRDARFNPLGKQVK